MKFARKVAVTGLVGAMGLSGAGCANNTETGALAGGATGAAVGAAVFRHVPIAGALFGGAVGALTGAAIGNSVDRQEAYREGYYYHYPPPPPREVVPPAPFAGAVWQPGYWVREPGAWVWVQGHWR